MVAREEAVFLLPVGLGCGMTGTGGALTSFAELVFLVNHENGLVNFLDGGPGVDSLDFSGGGGGGGGLHGTEGKGPESP